MNVTAGAKTDTGQRPNNEDRFAIVDTRRRLMRADSVLIIADGMGGRNFGETAAEAAVETTEESLAELLDTHQTDEVAISEALVTALRKANARVYELAHSEEDRKGMGTTCVAAVVEGDRAYIAHAGDSRAYLFQDGKLSQVTADHSYVAEQVRAGTITEEGARTSRFRNIITRAIGIEPTLEAEVSEVEVRPGDWLLLCTDGLSNVVEETHIARTLAQAHSPQAAADKLVQMAVKNGGRDNITAIVARLQAGTRTLRLRVADLLPEDPEDLAALEAESVPQVPLDTPRSKRAALWPALSMVFLVLGAGVSGWLAHLLSQDGYQFQAAPPFAAKPLPPPPPTPPDLAQMGYEAPQVLFPKPVRGALLTVNSQDGSVTVATLGGPMVTLEPESDNVRYKYTLGPVKPQPPAPNMGPGAGGQTLHTATDPQGNLYVSDALAGTITKYRPNGKPLGLVAHRGLTNPQAIGVAADGTVYLIDAERLKILKAHPSSTPLPPIPPPTVAKPATFKPTALLAYPQLTR